jgi:hypothetical protein
MEREDGRDPGAGQPRRRRLRACAGNGHAGAQIEAIDLQPIYIML